MGGRSPETTARAPTRSTRHQISRRVRFTRLARQIHAQLLQRIADVIDGVSLPSQQRAVSGADVLMTWLLARLLTWRMTSACHVTQSTVMGADVAMTWLSTWLLTSADPTHDPVNRSTGSDPTRSTVNRVTGQPDPVNGSTQPGQRSTGSTRSIPTRSIQPSPVHALPRASPRADPSGGA